MYNIMIIMLNYKLNMLNKKWSYVNLLHSNSTYIPKTSGVYVIASMDKRLLQLPLGMEVKYIGKSKNLRKRYLRHIDFRKGHNPTLNNLIKTQKNLEFWFLETDLEELNFYESVLIKEASKTNQDLVNQIKMKTYKGEMYV